MTMVLFKLSMPWIHSQKNCYIQLISYDAKIWNGYGRHAMDMGNTISHIKSEVSNMI